MISKSKIALIAALAVSIASPAFAQSFNKGDGTANELPFAYGPGGAKSAWTTQALPNEQLAAQQIGTNRFAVRENGNARVAAAHARGLYAYAAVPSVSQASSSADSPALTGGGSTGYNQMLLQY
jgi:hypothetical protein